MQGVFVVHGVGDRPGESMDLPIVCTRERNDCSMFPDTFAAVFNRTRRLNYLTTSRLMATYFVNHIPSNGIVPWCVQSSVFNRISFDGRDIKGLQCPAHSTTSCRHLC